jgi:DNA-binding transcriptional MerR regulator
MFGVYGEKMNISELAKVTGVTTDTLRYYEKQHLLDLPARQDNGYRCYTDKDMQRVRFIRSAQLLGFSLAEILEIIPKLVVGTFGRAEIEQRLTTKMTQIDQHIMELQQLKKELAITFDSLTCSLDTALTVTASTRDAPVDNTQKPVSIKRNKRK